MSGVLVHEWLAQNGGSENVFHAMSVLFPDAPLYCLWNDSTGRFPTERIRESWLARTPLRRSKAAALALMPMTWRMVRDRGFDWALISSHAFAHHARFRGAPRGFRRMVYVHTPARYVWTPDLDARGEGFIPKAVSHTLRPVDRRRAAEGAEFAANSEYVRTRIRQAWNVDARVIHPPVEVERIQAVADWTTELTSAEQELLDGLPTGFVLGASRFIPYKQLDKVIEVGEASGRPVVLAGHGPSEGVLRQRAREASVPVHFVLSPSNALLFALYQATAVYVFPAVEDFGIMPVEAMAAGAPVLTRNFGGTAESTVPGATGALVGFESAAEMREGVELAMATDPVDRCRHATNFSVARFNDKISSWVGMP